MLLAHLCVLTNTTLSLGEQPEEQEKGEEEALLGNTELSLPQELNGEEARRKRAAVAEVAKMAAAAAFRRQGKRRRDKSILCDAAC